MLFTRECRNTMIGGISWHHLSAMAVPSSEYTDFSLLVSLRVSGRVRSDANGTKIRLRVMAHPIVMVFIPFLIITLLFCVLGALIFRSDVLSISAGVEAVLILSLISFTTLVNQWKSEVKAIRNWVQLVNHDLGDLSITVKWAMQEQPFE